MISIKKYFLVFNKAVPCYHEIKHNTKTRDLKIKIKRDILSI